MLLHLLGGRCYGSCTRIEVLYGLFIQLILLAYVAHGLLGGKLLALLLGVAEASAKLHTLDAHATAEGGAVGAYGVLIDKLKHDGKLRLLAPLDELALVVHLLVGYLIEVEQAMEDALVDELHATGIATVEIDGTDEGFKGISTHVAIVAGTGDGGLDKFVEANLYGYAVECIALHHLRAGVSEKSFAFTLKMMIHQVAYDGSQDGIAQKLQALVVHTLAISRAGVHRLVHQRLLVVVQMAGIETKDSL